MRKLVIIPGGFHPFHAGHKALYDAAREAFPSADIFVAATADTSSRPFPFEIKKKLARIAGVSGHRFIQVKSPFQAREITQMYDPADTQLIFVRSEKDREQQPQAGGMKRDGSASYLQPFKRNGLEPMSKHGYMAYLPTVQFGPGMTSATEIRAKWPGMTPEQKTSLVQQLYPDTQQKTGLAAVIVKMFDEIMGTETVEGAQGAQAGLMGMPVGSGAGILQRTATGMANGPDRERKGVRMGVEFDEQTDALKPPGTYAPLSMDGYNTSWLEKVVTGNRPVRGITPALALTELRRRMADPDLGTRPSAPFTAKYLRPDVQEATLINDPDAGIQIQPAGGMGTWDESSLVSNLARKFASMVEMVKSRNYSGLHYALYRAGVVESMVRALAELEAFEKKQGQRPIARGREIDITDYIDEK